LQDGDTLRRSEGQDTAWGSAPAPGIYRIGANGTRRTGRRLEDAARAVGIAAALGSLPSARLPSAATGEILPRGMEADKGFLLRGLP